MKDTSKFNKRIDNMNSYELGMYLKERGLHKEYKDYSINAIKNKLKERNKYFNS